MTTLLFKLFTRLNHLISIIYLQHKARHMDQVSLLFLIKQDLCLVPPEDFYSNSRVEMRIHLCHHPALLLHKTSQLPSANILKPHHGCLSATHTHTHAWVSKFWVWVAGGPRPAHTQCPVSFWAPRRVGITLREKLYSDTTQVPGGLN